MDSLLNGLFGGQSENRPRDRQQVEDFVSRYEQGAPWDNISDEEAQQNYQAVASRLSPEELESAAADTYARLSPEERRQFAQWLEEREGTQASQVNSDDPRQLARMTTQLQTQQPDGLAGLLGGGGLEGLLGGGGGGALGGLLGGSQQQSGGQQNLLGKAVMGGIAAMAMKKMLGNR